MRVSDIGKSLNMVDSNVSTMCSRLERIGLIERFRPKEDQRVVKIQLTAAAGDNMADIKSKVAEFQDLVFKNVAEDDLKVIVLGLTKYNNLLDLAVMQETCELRYCLCERMKSMKTILITGGTSGIGKGLAINYLKNGHRVIVVGSSNAKWEAFYEEAKKLEVQERAIFLKADLS